jgi:molybdopterin converting factor subunit 1
MRVQIRLFAAAREGIHRESLEQTLPTGATLQDLVDVLYADRPVLREMKLRFAVNSAYQSLETVLHDGDEVACIPPVGGG